MEQLYNVRICKFKDKEKTEYGYRFIIDENSFQEFIGIKYDDKFIDIKDGISYRVLKKNGNYIDSSEEKNIKIGEYYVNQAEPYIKSENKKRTKNYLLNIRKLITGSGKQIKKTR